MQPHFRIYHSVRENAESHMELTLPGESVIRPLPERERMTLHRSGGKGKSSSRKLV